MAEPRLVKDPKTGLYAAHWSVDRRSFRRSLKTADGTIARQRFADMFSGASVGNAAAMAARTVEECWRLYVVSHETPDTATAWKRLAPFFNIRKAAAIGQVQVDAYVESRRQDGVVDGTIRKELLYLVACLNWNAKRQLIPPVLSFDLPPASPPRTTVLSDDQVRALLDEAYRHRSPRLSSTLLPTRVERFLWLALETAGRAESILNLTWSRVDFDAGLIDLEFEPGRAESSKRRPVVPMSPRLRAFLLDLRSRLSEVTIGLVLGQPPRAIWNDVQRLVIAAGLAPAPKRGERLSATGISPHVFRHTAATNMVKRGVPLAQVAAILGNSVRVVEKTYAHLQPGHLREAVAQISGGL